MKFENISVEMLLIVRWVIVELIKMLINVVIIIMIKLVNRKLCMKEKFFLLVMV